MFDRIITWLIKRLVLLWDRHNDKIAFSFGRDERTDYSILVERFYDDYYIVGTARYPYPNCGDDMMEEPRYDGLRTYEEEWENYEK